MTREIEAMLDHLHAQREQLEGEIALLKEEGEALLDLDDDEIEDGERQDIDDELFALRRGLRRVRRRIVDWETRKGAELEGGTE